MMSDRETEEKTWAEKATLRTLSTTFPPLRPSLLFICQLIVSPFLFLPCPIHSAHHCPKKIQRYCFYVTLWPTCLQWLPLLGALLLSSKLGQGGRGSIGVGVAWLCRLHWAHLPVRWCHLKMSLGNLKRKYYFCIKLYRVKSVRKKNTNAVY